MYIIGSLGLDLNYVETLESASNYCIETVQTDYGSSEQRDEHYNRNFRNC